VRFLGIGETNDLGDMYLRLQHAGHEVRVHMSDPDSAGVLDGMIDFTDDWRAGLDWIRTAGRDGIVLFETAGHGELQDELRKDGYNVIGGSAFGDRLETDRGFGQKVLADLGLKTAGTRVVEGFDNAIEFVGKHPARYVFKLNGHNWPSTSTYVGQFDSGSDMVALMRGAKRAWTLDETPSCVLMDYVEGVEVGTGAYFNGERFLSPANLDWEHKRFFPGDIGEMTGEMGTIVTYRGAEKIFDATLGKLAPLLAESGYCGYINLNTIVNANGIWPLEFTARFGYPGFPILSALHDEGWDSIFAAMINRDRTTIRTHSGIAAGVVLTVPSFPYPDGYAELGKGMPIVFDDSMTEADRDALHFGEVTLLDGQLATAGMIGYIMVVTGAGDTVKKARQIVYDRVKKIAIPRMRYRNDIGSRFESDCALLRKWGWLE
jgi:phosphoribosylamine--glycine ligase